MTESSEPRGSDDGRVVIVTGGGSGIGRATSAAFAALGWTVVISDVDESAGEEVLRELANGRGHAEFVPADVTHEADVERLVGTTVERYGCLRAAVNCAGIADRPSELHEVSEEAWQRVLDVNLTAVWRCMKFQIRAMLEGGGGSIVNMSSKVGLSGGPKRASYTATKHGIVGLSRTAALEYADRAIRVNSVCPSAVRTPLLVAQMAADPALEERYASMSPAGRLALPEEVAAAVVWLCSDGASFVSGVALPVDGGTLA